MIIDFGRDSALSVALSGSGKWGVSANFNTDGKDPVPTADLEVWQALILKKSGATVTDIVFTTTPWQKFLNAEGVQGGGTGRGARRKAAAPKAATETKAATAARTRKAAGDRSATK